MKFVDTFKTSLVGLKTNKFQSALTMLGIIISIGAIILMMSIGEGAERLITQQIDSLGADTLFIRPGKEPTGPSDFADTLFADSLTTSDLEALKRKSNAPTIVELAPAVLVAGSATYEGETYRPSIFGWNAEFMARLFDLFPEEGDVFGEEAERNRENVVVIGTKVRDELFGDKNAIGESIKIKGKNFKVIGIWPQKGELTFFNVDEAILMPYTTAQTQLLGIDHFHEIMVKAESAEAVPRTVRDIELTLREQHNITDPDKDDFFVVTQQGTVDQITTILSSLTILLTSVVAIALVVGGIGVMNIMLVSVTERTREIGLRKAVGATNSDIMIQFLLETVILTLIGGAVGILSGGVLAYLTAFGLNRFTDLNWEFIFPISALFLGFGVSGTVGLIFGIYPARKAASKSPIEALRYE